MTPQQANELLPCPFCGGAATVKNTTTSYIIECDNARCGANPDVHTTFKHEAIAAWNRRAPAPTEPAVDRDAVCAAYAWHLLVTLNGEFIRGDLTLNRHSQAQLDELKAHGYDYKIVELVATPASPAVPASRDHLLKIIAFAYQIAGWHDAPEHILDVLADPEGATAAQVDAMLPYQVGASPAVPAGHLKEWIKLFSRVSLALNCLPSGFVDGNEHVVEAAQALAAVPAVPEPAPLAPSEAILKARAEGRAEAVQIIMGMDAEDALGELTGWSSPVGPEDEGSAYWDLAKLQEKFACDDVLLNLFDKAEAMYWEASAERDEAVRAKAFAENMGSSAKVRDILAKAGEFDLMGQLCRPADPAPQVAQASQPTSAEGKDAPKPISTSESAEGQWMGEK